MKYLIVGDANSMHIYNFVKNVLLYKDIEIFLFTLSIEPINNNYREFYGKNDIVVFSVAEHYKYIENNNYFSRVINLLRKYLLFKKIPKMDICHIQSVYKTSLLLYLNNKRKFKKLILSYWGGDIEDVNKRVIKVREKTFCYANKITVTVEQTLLDFQKIYGHKYDKKLQICRFATEGLEEINKIASSKTKFEIKEEFSIPKNKICITCGYSAYRTQHQDKIIYQLSKLSNAIKKNIFIIIPMQYGRNDMEYIEMVKKQATESSIEYMILEEYFSFNKMAKLSLATDIYINLRDTDAFSNTLKEQVFSGSVVVSGSWLKYLELEKMNAPLIKIDSFKELPLLIESIINNFDDFNTIKLFQPIYQLYGTNSIRNQWSEVIEETLNAEKN